MPDLASRLRVNVYEIGQFLDERRRSYSAWASSRRFNSSSASGNCLSIIQMMASDIGIPSLPETVLRRLCASLVTLMFVTTIRLSFFSPGSVFFFDMMHPQYRTDFHSCQVGSFLLKPFCNEKFTLYLLREMCIGVY